MDSQEIFNLLKFKGYNITEKELKTYLSDIDIEKLTEEENNRYRYEIWDKKTPINGVAAKDIIASRPYSINQAYIVYIDDKLVYFQDCKPFVNGIEKLTKANVEEVAKDFIQKKVNQDVQTKVIQILTQKYLIR